MSLIFQAKTRNELSFVSGQQLILAPKDQQPSLQGWLLASNGNNVGLVPANYIKIVGLRPPLQQQASNTQKGQKGLSYQFLLKLYKKIILYFIVY